MNARRFLVCSVPLLWSGCSGDGNLSPGSDAGSMTQINTGLGADGARAGTSLLPWKEGNTWTYRVTDNGEVTSKVITVGPLEPVGGSGVNKDRLANKVVTKKGPTDQTLSWQAVDMNGQRVIRLREQAFGAKTGLVQLDEFYDPYKLHVDGTAAHSVTGASWIETYQDRKDIPDAGSTTTTATDAWQVDGVDIEVTVPAGTFKTIVFIKGGGKTYWYKAGVGKIKETGGQTEELVSYTVAP